MNTTRRKFLSLAPIATVLSAVAGWCSIKSKPKRPIEFDTEFISIDEFPDWNALVGRDAVINDQRTPIFITLYRVHNGRITECQKREGFSDEYGHLWVKNEIWAGPSKCRDDDPQDWAKDIIARTKPDRVTFNCL